mgnify:FL=1
MLELFSSGVVSLWLQMSGVNRVINNGAQRVSWQVGLPSFVISNDSDSHAVQTMQQYIKDLSAKGLAQGAQGIWLSSNGRVLATHQEKLLMPGASLTKIATSLTALQMLGPNYQWETRLRTTGFIKNGVLQGDLIIEGFGDPLFVWEEAIALGNNLNQLGITGVTGNLIVTGNFFMNYEKNPLVAGELFRLGLDSPRWAPEIISWYSKMPPGTKKPQVTISGLVTSQKSPVGGRLLLRRRSLPLVEILKQMNVHSDNDLAQLLADQLGGGKIVQKHAIALTGIPEKELNLINGSGLGEENKMTPKTACSLFETFQRYLQNSPLTIADFFPMAGRDKGTIEHRQIPKNDVVKTGTLDNIIALAGILPTQEQGLVCFAIINRGNDWDGLRSEQDVFLQNLVKLWGTSPTLSPSLTPHINGNLPGYGKRDRTIFSSIY